MPFRRAGSVRRACALVLGLGLLAEIAACSRGAARLDGLVVVANSVSRDLVVFRGPSMELVRRVALPGSPQGLGIEPGGRRAWTANKEGNTTSVVDLSSGRILATVRVCKGPVDVAFAPEHHRAWVACDDGYLVGIDTRTLERVGVRHAIGFAPRELVAGPRGRLWAANRGSNDLSEIDPATGRLIERHPAAPFAYGLAFTPNARYAFVTSKRWNAVSVLSTRDMRILGAIEVDGDPSLIVVSRDGARAYVASRKTGRISVIDARTFQVVGRIDGVGRDPESLALSPDGGLLFVASHRSGTLFVVDTRRRSITQRLQAGEGPIAVAIA